ncbi:hypothetical protein AB0C59_09870 [Streptomyces sp. NPDC048664]|uniref:hypothetical protein n=1 Tax=Streptomyces sp. NPDC048664 TaxID=3154505 RepID=UPI003431A2B5
MARVRRSLLVCAAAAALSLTVPPGTAHATSGFFLYTKQPRHIRYMLYEPLDDVCYVLTGQGRTLNESDRTAQLYADPDCGGEVALSLPPDSGVLNASFTSVRFVE